MSSQEFQFMLWVQDSDGAWKLRKRSRRREEIENEASRLPRTTTWRFVSLFEGLLAESLVIA